MISSRQPEKRPSVLLFDLGGVLVENKHIVDGLGAFLDRPLDEETVRERWLRSASARDFERGRISPGIFATRFLREWGAQSDPQAFLDALVSWLGEPYPGATGVVARLRGDHHVSCLTNCNELHWAKLATFTRNFDSAFSSHLAGEVKPDAEAFEVVLNSLQVRPENVRFFDDSRSNVEGAEAVGIRGFHVAGIRGLRECLESEGLL